jgi:hypothetical protein
LVFQRYKFDKFSWLHSILVGMEYKSFRVGDQLC